MDHLGHQCPEALTSAASPGQYHLSPQVLQPDLDLQVPSSMILTFPLA